MCKWTVRLVRADCEGTSLISRLPVCFVLFFLAGLALWIGSREYAAHMFSAQTPSRAFEAISLDAGVPVPPSVRGRRGMMVGCLDALSQSAVQFQSTQDVRRVAERCDGLARRVLATSPTLSAAHLVRMEARFAQGDLLGTVASLQHSGQTARRALWISLRRVQMVQNLPEAMQLTVEQTMRADVALMFESIEGRQVLAQFYGQDSALRPLILEVAETRPNDEQDSFLSLTRGVLQ